MVCLGRALASVRNRASAFANDILNRVADVSVRLDVTAGFDQDIRDGAPKLVVRSKKCVNHTYSGWNRI